MSPRRVGLLGGTFDPVHNAHLALAQAALAAGGLEEVRWIPSGQPWQKARAITPAADREAMVRLAIDGEVRFRLDRIELVRSGPSYTLDTVQQLRQQEPETEWVLLLGRDQYDGLGTWHRFGELLHLVKLAVAQRPGAVAADTAKDATTGPFPYRSLPMAPCDLSSSVIREAVRQGQDISRLVPPGVARYIEKNGLYRA